MSGGERKLLTGVEGLLDRQIVHREPIDDEGETRIAMIGDNMKRSDIRRTKPPMGFARFFGGKGSIKLDFSLLGRRKAKRRAS